MTIFPGWGSMLADLQLRVLVLEIFFERVGTKVEVKVCRAYGARTLFGIRCPSPSGLG